MNKTTEEKLEDAKKEIEKLKSEITSWRNAWYDLRDKLGKLWWRHPSIHDDKQREYYKKAIVK